MNLDNARRLVAALPPDAKVVDIGGGAAPFPRADFVIDALPFDHRGDGSAGSIHKVLDCPVRYSQATWIQIDLCDRKPWPVEDKAFDYAICSHLLEDIRDPIWVCSEIRRIAKCGYVEIPSRYFEQSKGIENPLHAGHYHHRWLITVAGNRLEFRHKPHVLHSLNDAIVARLRPGRTLNPKYRILTLEWEGDFEAVELLEFDETRVIDELCDFARQARRLTDLVIPEPIGWLQSLKRRIYFARMAMGRR